MCGIAGIIGGHSIKDHRQAAEAMTSCLSHRGPDEMGIKKVNGGYLGHRRLSVVDLGNGQQPMSTPQGGTHIVFNGEVYGYKSIKNQLPEYPFRTNSDTEVILALYDKYGSKLCEYLPGMFAFAIWDDKSQTLTCGRDRFGEKPFYYAITPQGDFIFSSEIKAIISSGLITPELNQPALTHYLKHLYVSPYQTIYKNIHTLPPAHQLIWHSGTISINRYWKFPEINESISLTEATTTFHKLLNSSVEKQLVADVPVGAFLSGGLDSSTIVALASKHTNLLKTFSFSFENAVSELPFACEIAEKYQTDHTELSDSHYDIATLILEMAKVYDEPFADSSNIPTYLISKLAKEHVTVVLTGDGGDELLGGYSGWYQPLLAAQTNSFTLNPQVASFAQLISKVFHKFRLPQRSILGHWLAGDTLRRRGITSLINAHEDQNTYFNNDALRTLLKQPLTVNPYKPHWSVGTPATLDDVMRMDVDSYMPGDILTKIDRASMAHGLELRAPFLDKDVAEFCLSLPYQLKISSQAEKILLRRAFENAWTPSIRNRQKQGFGAPVNHWLKLPAVEKLRHNYLDDPSLPIYTLISYEKARPYVSSSNYQTWILLTLSIWLSEQVDNNNLQL